MISLFYSKNGNENQRPAAFLFAVYDTALPGRPKAKLSLLNFIIINRHGYVLYLYAS